MITNRTTDAKKLIAHGFKIFPCRPSEKIPATAHGCKDATGDPATINSQFVHGENVAIATGHDGLFVVDFDLPDGPADFEEAHEPLPQTVGTMTPRGGIHWYFRSAKNVKNSQSKLADKVDVRGQGGYVIAPPSTVNEKQYQWLPGCSPDEVAIASAPAWLEALVCEPQPAASSPPSSPRRPSSLDDVSPLERARKYVGKMPPAISGRGGHNATLEVAATCFRFGLDNGDAWNLLSEFNERCEPQWNEKELRHKLADAYAKVQAAGEIGAMLEPQPPRQSSRPRPTATATAATAAKVFAPGDPMPTAEGLIEAKYTVDGVPTLVSHLGEFLCWRDGAYRPVEGDAIRAAAYDFLADAMTPEEKPFAPNARKIGDVIDAMQAKRFLPASVTPPCWLAKAAGRPDAAECVAFPNGILHLPTGEVMPPTPELFCRSALSFNYVPDAPEPIQWLNFLSQLWPDDPESIELLREYFGYILTADTRQQKALLKVGPKRSGKTTIARIATELVGQEFVANPTLASLCFPFGLAPLAGKSLAIIGDARIGPHTDSSIAAERLLSIIGEDSISVDRKFLPSVSSKLPTRFMILSNELPRFSDSSGALSGRMLTLILKECHGALQNQPLKGAIQGFKTSHWFSIL